MVRQKANSRMIIMQDLPIGKFADMNGSVVYRYQNPTPNNMTWFPGVWFIENHNHLPLHEAASGKDEKGQHAYLVEPYDIPAKKHVDQAINLLKKAVKDKQVNGLTYLDNYVTLKEYLKNETHKH